MTGLDAFGQTISLDRKEDLDSWNSMMIGFLAHSAGVAKPLVRVLESQPNFALGFAVKGLFYLLMGRSELIPPAFDALAQARAALKNAPAEERERVYVQALAAWCDESPERCIALLEKILERHPRDALAMKLSHAIRFMLGDEKGMRQSLERVMSAYGSDHPAEGYFWGCYAFTLEETGEYEKAEKAGHRALELAPDDAWGLHAVAHVFDMTANAKAGLDWLEGREAAWMHCNNFRYHVWWHKALMHLDLGQMDEVFALYDSEIRKDKTDDYRDISNAASLLSRLELEGVKVGDRWEELADFSVNRTQDGCLIFADLHYALAMMGDGRSQAAAELMARMQKDAECGKIQKRQRMGAPGLAALAGLLAFSEGDYDSAFSNLERSRANMKLAGGSHAQRDIFERFAIDAAIRAGRGDKAETLLNERQKARGGHEDGYAQARRALIAESLAAAKRFEAAK